VRIGITCYPTYGGSGAVATELGLELARRGHEIHFISYASPFRLRGFAERVTFHEVVTAEYPLFEHSPYALALAVKQHEVALRENLDLMHVHYAIPHAATAWLAKQMMREVRDLKVVTTLHGTDITLVGQDPSYFTLTTFSIEQSDAVTAVSAYLRDETYRAFGCTGCAIEVIPNFVSPADYHPATDAATCRRALAPPQHKVLVHVSNFRPVKRVVDVVKIFEGVRRALPATLVFVGDGPERDGAEREVDRLGLRKDVRFLGKVDNVADVLRGADLFLLPSQSESFGLAALEAMACAVPVVASRAGGIPEVIDDGVTGYLADVGDVRTMTARAVSILSDQALHERMRGAAAKRALVFASDAVVPRYEQLYTQVLDD
jgi:N-acetyl-alpha-D-glucosaminyl L-malate synthase BshA